MRNRPQKVKKAAALEEAQLSQEEERDLEEQLTALRQALAGGADLEGLTGFLTAKPDDLLWDCRLIRELGKIDHAAMPALLTALFGGSPDRERRKALKRALHGLRSRGVVVPAELWRREEASPQREAAAPPLKAFVTPVHGSGERFVVLEGAKMVLGGTFLVARISDLSGFLECNLYDLGRKGREDFWQAMRREGIDTWVPAPAGYAVGVLEESFRLVPEGSEVGASYRLIRDRLLKYHDPAKFSVLQGLLPILGAGERGDLQQGAEELAANALFYSWMPSPQSIPPLLARLAEVENSPLVLSEALKQERLEKIIEEATVGFFPPESRHRWGRRLLEMAYYFELKGRRRESRLAQAAGEDLLEHSLSELRGESIFLKELVWQAVELTAQLKKELEEAGREQGRVVIPSGPVIIHS